MAKIANVFWYCRDWKEGINTKWLQKSMKKIAAMRKAVQVLDGSDAVQSGDDSISTIVCPANVQWTPISDDSCDLLGYADAIHATKDGNLFFRFPAESGFPATDWLDEKAANAHLDKIQAAAAAEEDKAWELKQKREAAKKKRGK